MGQMETAFGADFSSVRMSEGPEAPAIGAAAYTRGEEIRFAPGQYNPGSTAGRELIGHELAHVVQQRRASTPGRSTPGGRAFPAEEKNQVAP